MLQKPAEGQITCNDVVLIREKVTAKKDMPKGPVLDTASNEYVYDIYYTKNSNINLDLLYANNYEITPVFNKDQLIILDENQDEDDEGRLEVFQVCGAIKAYHSHSLALRELRRRRRLERRS